MNSCQLVIACAAGAGFFQPVAALPCHHRRPWTLRRSLRWPRPMAATTAESGRSSVTVVRQVRSASATDHRGACGGAGDGRAQESRGCIGVLPTGAGPASRRPHAELGPGDLVAVPPQRHDLEALEPSVLLLTGIGPQADDQDAVRPEFAGQLSGERFDARARDSEAI
jgi:hypothetical protein